MYDWELAYLPLSNLTSFIKLKNNCNPSKITLDALLVLAIVIN